MRIFLVAAFLACVTTAAAAQPFAPEAFFAGSTRSTGVMMDAGGQPKNRLAGTTRGQRQPDGSTVFDQTIRFDDGTTKQRRWRVVRTGPASVEATGTDIVGTARGTIAGPTLRLLSTIQASDGNPLGVVDFDQTMTLAPGGRTLRILSTISVLGVAVRRIDEVFVKTGAR